MFSLNNKILMAAATVGMLLTGGAATVANAQDNQMPPQGQGQQQQQYQQQGAQDPFGGQQQQVDISNEQLENFVEAEDAARQVQTEFQGQATDVTSPEEMAALREQMNAQMTAAIEQTGMSVEQYSLVLTAIQSDPQIREKYINMVQ